MTERPERKRSRSIRRYPFLELWEHDVATGGGERTVVTLELRDWVVIAARDTSGRWILVEQHRHGVDGLTLEPAGGIVDEGEEPGLAASRELLEETGYGGGAPRSLGSCHPNPALSANRAHFFLIDGARKECEPACPPDELTHVVLLGDEDLDVALAQGRITHALAEIALTRARRETSAVLARLASLEHHQAERVLALARRLRPGLSPEDVLSPHDFPELADPDWAFEDGVLAGIRATKAALLAARRQESGE